MRTKRQPILTDSTVKRLQFDHTKSCKQYTISDHGDAPGLVLRMSVGGSKTWCLHYKSPITQKASQFTIGRFPDFSCSQARQRAHDLRRSIALKIDPRETEKERIRQLASKPDTTFGHFVAEYANYCEANYIKHKVITALLSDKYLPRDWYSRDSMSIERTEVRALYKTLCEQRTENVANNVVKRICALYNWIIKERDVQLTNPASSIAGKDGERTRVLTDEELRLIYCAGTPFVKLLILTGQRRTNVAHLSMDNIGNDRIWTIDKTKMNRQHRVPLTDMAFEVAKQHKPRSLNYGVEKKKTDHLPITEPWVFHDLRRTFATGLARLGVKQSIIELLLDHQPKELSGVAAIYNRYHYDEEKREAMQRWSDFVSELVARKE